MKPVFTFLLLALISIYSFQLKAQTDPVNPTLVGTGVFLGETPPLRDLPVLTAEEIEIMKQKALEKAARKKIEPRLYPFAETALPKGQDEAWQKTMGKSASAKAPIVNFEGQTTTSFPPDCNGTAGPSHYMQTVNLTYAIYNKTGTKLAGPTALNTLFTGVPGATVNDGDPIVLYDEQADRWLVAEFTFNLSNDYMLVAVSTTNDPTGTWYKYSFDVTNDPDYPKFGIWRDGYYMGINSTSGNDIYVFERSKMLLGQTAQMIGFDNAWRPGTGFLCVPPLDNDGAFAPAGSPGTFIAFNDDAVSGGSDQLWIYELTADWTTPASSTFIRKQQLAVTAFDSQFTSSWDDIAQPTSQKLDGVPQVIMNAPQYRNFGSYQTIVCCHTVDVDATNHAGVRWYELRRGTETTGGWAIRQQGTYAPDANSRWMGSIMLNGSGKIGLAYSISSSTLYPGIRYCGQSTSAYTTATGVLDIPEEIIHNGTVAQTTYNRWGDYALLSIDPADDQTFWFTTEYVKTGGTTKGSKIASFKFGNNPTVVTQAATAVTGTSATINGTVNPNGLATNYYFQWGTTTSYGNTTSSTSAGSGTTAVAVNANLTGLPGGQIQHYRLVATNSDGTTNGTDMNFTPGAASVTTTIASAIAQTTATSGGNVTTDGGSAVTVRGVCWATTASPVATGNHTTDGSGSGSFSSSITGLLSSTLYHVRAYATNGNGTYYGDDLLFTTLCGIYNTLPFTQNFDDITIPPCWTQIDNQGNNQVWQFGTITGQSPNPALTGNYAYLNSDAYGSGNSQNADLVTPTLDLSGYSAVTMAFSHYFKQYTGSSGTVAYSINNGSTWTSIQTFTNTSASNPIAFSQAVAAVAGQSQVKFKWNYTGTWGYYWGIDNISITGTAVATITTGTISGSPFCAGVAVSVPFTITGSYTAGNIFTAQLSDATGGFSSPANIGTLSSTTAGTISATIPSSTASGTGYRVRVISSNPAVTGTANSVNLTVNPLPVAAGTISGATTVCQGQNTVTYTVPAITNATTYVWTLPTGATGSSSTNSITVNYGATAVSGSISVKGNNSCGDGTLSSLGVTVNPLPAAAGLISGLTTVCQGQNTVTYTVPAITNATTYVWTLPTGATGSSSTNSITVNYGATAVSGNVTVKGNNSCGDGTPASLAITANPLPAAAGTISGSTTVCQGQNSVTYTVPAITNATTYVWTLPGGANGSSLTNSITANYGASAVSGNITVKGNNACGDGTPASLAITVNPLPAAAGTISGSTTVCQGQNPVIYTVPAITNASTYVWTLPTGAAGSSSTNSITVNYGLSAVSGNITVKGNNTCGDGSGSLLFITLNSPTLPALSVSASATDICTGSSITLTQSGGSLGTGAHWQWYSDPTYSTAIGGALTSPDASLTITPSNTASYYVRGEGTAGPCASNVGDNTKIVTVTVHLQPLSGYITKNPAVEIVCEGTSVSATATMGTGGAGSITDFLEYSYNGGSWNTYISGLPLNTTGYSSVDVRTYRTSSVSGCSNSTPAQAGWTVTSPSALNASNITFTSADLNWTDLLGTMWNIEYGEQGFIQGSGTVISNVTAHPYTLAGLNPGTPYSFYVQTNCGGSNSVWKGPSLFTTVIAPDKTLQLTVFLEGLFNGTTMNKAKDASGDKFAGTVADQITVELHNATSPFALAGGPYTVNVNTDGTASLTVSGLLSSSYYIVVNHRNSIETWNGIPVSFSGASLSYNFSNAASQAYGNNLKLVSGKYVIYAGDVNQDGVIGSADISNVDVAASAFANGYIPTDVNGDGVVDADDLILLDNNSALFIVKVTP